MTNIVRRFLALSARERWTILGAWIELVVIDVRLRSTGFQKTAAWARQSAAAVNGADAGFAQRATNYARCINIAAGHHVVRARCLHKSLALHAWLQREGLASDLRIGVRPINGELKAHAWVELDGCPVNEVPEAVAAFTPLVGPPVRLAWLP